MKKEQENSVLMDWISLIATALIIAFVIHSFILSSTIIDGSSMNPTLEDRDRLLVNKISAHINRYQHGDIVEFHAPDRDGDYIKRIIGLPGDTVEILDNEVYVNGQKIHENYTSSQITLLTKDQNRWVVEEGQVFVMGDNRMPGGSHDSRSFDTIDMDSIVGIAFFRFMPLSRIGRL
ncbi:MAG: signal peptidase I [Tissierellia bacterium]|nr:signal peptidase I [Tissierellia bacterium]